MVKSAALPGDLRLTPAMPPRSLTALEIFSSSAWRMNLKESRTLDLPAPF